MICINKILCGKFNKLLSAIDLNSIDLSIVYPPSEKINTPQKIKILLNQLNKITKHYGICCFLIENEINPISDIMSTDTLKYFLEIFDLDNKWHMFKTIIWVKKHKEFDNIEQKNFITPISYDETPFVFIFVLIKNNLELTTMNLKEKIQSLSIAQMKKNEITDDCWFIHPTSECHIIDKLPSKLVSRLLALFTKENDLVLDPFGEFGITPLVCKNQNRHFICIEENESSVIKSLERMKIIDQE